MAADTFSSFLGFTLQGTGNNNNAWGVILNAAGLQNIEKAIAGNVTHAVTGGTLALDGTVPPAGLTPALEHIQVFTGVLASAQIVQMPNISKVWYISNRTTGAFPLTVKTSGGTATQIPSGTSKYVVCDGANGMFRLDRDSVGDFVYSGGATRTGALACNGASLLKTDYPDLFAKIGTTYGSVDGLHFTLPLLSDTGRFLRSTTGSLALGTYQANLNASHSHTVTGAPGLGTLGTDAQGAHTPSGAITNGAITTTITNSANGGDAIVGTSSNSFASAGSSAPFYSGLVPKALANSSQAASTFTGNAVGNHIHNVTGAPSLGSLATATSGGAEARPESLAVTISIII